MSRRGKFILKCAVAPAFRFAALFLFTILLTTRRAGAQGFVRDSLRRAAPDTVGNVIIEAAPDSSLAASGSLEDSLGIRISDEALPAPVTATATDSSVADVKNNFFYLYGSAEVKHEELTLQSGRIAYNQESGTVLASPLTDTSTTENTFSQGSEKVRFDSMQYNFKSRRAIVMNARSQYGEGFVHSKQIKRNADASIFGASNIYTTCSLDTPHFAIRAPRIKIIPDRIIVSGAANLEIEGVPTPLYLPFGVFPISQTQRSGFRLPSYTMEQNRGLGLTKGGYYFYINDHVDLLTEANIYSKGSYSVSGVSTYAARYHYNGGVSFTYAYNKTGETYEPGSSIQKQYAFIWRHATDPKARPGVSFNSNVNVQSSDFYATNSYNANQIAQNQYTSNITYSRTWQGKPYSLSVALLHNQNTNTKQVNVSLPEVNFYISQFSPLKSKRNVGTPRWYERITASYNLNAANRLSFIDSGFALRRVGLSDFSNGIHHNIPVAAAYTLLRYINFSVGANYNEYWLTEQFYRFNNLNTGNIDTVINRGFYATRDFNATAQLSTRIYGIKRWRTGRLAGIRHVLTPNVGFNYTPDFAASPFRYYYRSSLDPAGTIEYRSPYERSPVGVPGLGQYGNFSSALNFGFNNNLQIKLRGRSKDTGAANERNVTLIDGLSFNSGYNIAADSFKWSLIATSFRTNILDVLSVTGSAAFDPYDYDHYRGRRSQRTVVDEGYGLARFLNANVALGASFRSKQRSGNNTQAATAARSSDEYTRLMRAGGYNDYVDFNIPWGFNVAYSLSLVKNYRRQFDGPDTFTYNQNLTLNGDFNLTPRWKVTFSTGYDFRGKSLTITSIDIYRDLHCWEMSLHTIPFGFNRNYTFTLNVKASVLHDLRLLRRRDFRDAVY